MSNEIEARVREMLKETLENGNEVDNLKADDDLTTLGVNSVTFIKLVIATELEFGIELEDEDLDFQNFSTINSIVNYISGSDNG